MRNLRKLVLAEIFLLLNERVCNEDDFEISTNLRLIRGCFCEMDSSSHEIFSRHVIIQMPYRHVFGTTEDCLIFVQRIISTIQRYNTQYAESK